MRYYMKKSSFKLEMRKRNPEAQAASTTEGNGEAIVEVVTRRPVTSRLRTKEVESFDSIYKEYKEDRVAEVMESPFLKIFGFLFNPTSMLVVLYLSSIGWSQVMWLQRIFKLFGRGVLAKRRKADTPVPTDELPFQTYECEVCQLEMRPARGRAEAIFGRPRFRCSRCGAKADAFFDVDDMEDARAVARLERLEAEANNDYDDDIGTYESDDDDDSDGDGDDFNIDDDE
jgi:hypothetical protein